MSTVSVTFFPGKSGISCEVEGLAPKVSLNYLYIYIICILYRYVCVCLFVLYILYSLPVWLKLQHWQTFLVPVYLTQHNKLNIEFILTNCNSAWDKQMFCKATQHVITGEHMLGSDQKHLLNSPAFGSCVPLKGSGLADHKNVALFPPPWYSYLKSDCFVHPAKYLSTSIINSISSVFYLCKNAHFHCITTFSFK